MAKHAPFICTPLVYHRAYNTYMALRVLVPGTSSWASTTTTAVRVYNVSIYMTLCTEHFTSNIFGTATAVTTVVVVLTLTHRYNAWPQNRLQELHSSSSVQYARNAMIRGSSWMKHTLAVRRSEMLPVRTRLAFRRGECLYHRPLDVRLL